MKIVGNSRFQKAANSSLILNYLREREECSRIDLSESLGLRPSTVTYIINRLMNMGLVREKKGTESATRNGRPPILLEINRDFGRIIGLDLQADYYNAVITDTAGKILQSRNKVYDKWGLSFEELLKNVLEDIIGEKKDAPIIGLGLAVPGIVDPENSIIKDCWTHNLKSRDFSSFFEESFDFPVIVENDANCCAWKSIWDNRELENFIYLLPRFHNKEIVPQGLPSIGVGLGLVLNGSVYHGFSHRAGEFRSVFMGNNDPGQTSLSMEEMDRIASDPLIKRKFMVELLKNLFWMINILNPRSIYIGGDLSGNSRMLHEILSNELKDDWKRIQQNDCTLTMLEEAAMDAAKGAAASILTELYSIPQINTRDLSPRKWKNLLSNINEQ